MMTNKLPIKPTRSTSSFAPQSRVLMIKRVLQFQLMFVTLFALVSVFFFGVIAARAVFLGALLAWISQAVFAWSVFRYAGARAQSAIVQGLFRGQFMKWTVCFIGFMLIFMLYKPDKPEFVMLGFALLTLTNWAYLLFVKR